ncbi:peptide deformylase [Parasphaerochaeta coccoides]|uniref:Peptide deformylase n=1 Tax=Parasphaerochaeta coccoides (strain ATCC BAA-1237 / DSM 17374 / SPN1) TaxID=760011 RepID=F4GI54_PARC1|nr:peptide deformylase [Parasphaerochaeta coccoides]AEC02652.1 peptide deformylase [Parasphaerochaeta coccoides DSM 17374]
MLEIVTLGEDVLRRRAEPVKVFDAALRLLVDDMFDSLAQERGVGLAAPQVGVSQRLFIVDIEGGEKGVFINPEIIETSMEQTPYEEGCLSIPGIWHDVVRPQRITMQAQDVTGKFFTVKADGMFARVLQHEYDHLNGTLFIDRLNEQDKKKVLDAYEKKQKPRKRAR